MSEPKIHISIYGLPACELTLTAEKPFTDGTQLGHLNITAANSELTAAFEPVLWQLPRCHVGWITPNCTPADLMHAMKYLPSPWQAKLEDFPPIKAMITPLGRTP